LCQAESRLGKVIDIAAIFDKPLQILGISPAREKQIDGRETRRLIGSKC
jgi:hypothetical protein